jgi:hypothetical protein
MKERDNSGDLILAENIILKYILKNWDIMRGLNSVFDMI